MTREEAYYERIKLLCGDWDAYDDRLNHYLETEAPLSDIVLTLVDCGDDMKEAERALNLYCQEKPFDQDRVYERLRLELYAAYREGRMSKDGILSAMFRYSQKIADDCSFVYGCGALSDYYVLAQERIVSMEKFDVILTKFLRDGGHVDLDSVWN